MFLFINKFFKTYSASPSGLAAFRGFSWLVSGDAGYCLPVPLPRHPRKPPTIYRGAPRSPLGTPFHLALFVSSPASALPCGRAALSPLCSWDNPCMEKRQLAAGELGIWEKRRQSAQPTPDRLHPPALQARTILIPTPCSPKPPAPAVPGPSSPERAGPAPLDSRAGENNYRNRVEAPERNHGHF